MDHNLYDEIGGLLEAGVRSKDLARRARAWHRRGYAEVYVDDEPLPRFEGRTPETCGIAA